MSNNNNDNNSNNNQNNSPFGNRRSPAPANNANANANNQQNQQQSSSSRFGSRFGSSNSNNNNQNNNQQNSLPGRSSLGSRFSGRTPFSDNTRSWTIQPLQKTVVRFELAGLGDPFARLLDYPLNAEYSNVRTLASVLEEKSEAVLELEGCLDAIWQGYGLEGAVMLYKWNQKAWKTITLPPTQDNQNKGNNDNDDEYYDEDDAKTVPQKPIFTCYRAIDVGLVLNILLRARSQVLVANAPPVFSSQYLLRSIMTDDPRVVDLVLATGFMEETV